MRLKLVHDREFRKSNNESFAHLLHVGAEDVLVGADRSVGEVLGLDLRTLTARLGVPLCEGCKQALTPVNAKALFKGLKGDRVVVGVPWTSIHAGIKIIEAGELYASQRAVLAGRLRLYDGIESKLKVGDAEAGGGVVLNSFEFDQLDDLYQQLTTLEKQVGFPLFVALIQGRSVVRSLDLQGGVLCASCDRSFDVEHRLVFRKSDLSSEPLSIDFLVGQRQAEALLSRNSAPNHESLLPRGVSLGFVDETGVGFVGSQQLAGAPLVEIKSLFENMEWQGCFEYGILQMCERFRIADISLKRQLAELPAAECFLIRFLHLLSISPAAIQIIIEGLGLLSQNQRKLVLDALREQLDEDSSVVVFEDSDIVTQAASRCDFDLVSPDLCVKGVFVCSSGSSILECCALVQVLRQQFAGLAESSRLGWAEQDFLLETPEGISFGKAANKVKLGSLTLEQLCHSEVSALVENLVLPQEMRQLFAVLTACGLGERSLIDSLNLGEQRAVECIKVFLEYSEDKLTLEGVFAGLTPEDAKFVEPVLTYIAERGVQLQVVSDQLWVTNRFGQKKLRSL